MLARACRRCDMLFTLVTNFACRTRFAPLRQWARPNELASPVRCPMTCWPSALRPVAGRAHTAAATKGAAAVAAASSAAASASKSNSQDFLDALLLLLSLPLLPPELPPLPLPRGPEICRSLLPLMLLELLPAALSRLLDLSAVMPLAASLSFCSLSLLCLLLPLAAWRRSQTGPVCAPQLLRCRRCRDHPGCCCCYCCCCCCAYHANCWDGCCHCWPRRRRQHHCRCHPAHLQMMRCRPQGQLPMGSPYSLEQGQLAQTP